MNSRSADSGMRTCRRPIRTKRMRRSSISRRGKRWLVLSSSAASATVSSRSADGCCLLGVMRPSRCRKIGASVLAAGSGSGFDQRGVPFLAVGDDVQQPLAVGHVVRVAGGDGFPGVPSGIVGRDAERSQQPAATVRAVVGEGLAGPFAGDQDAAAGVAEVLAAVGVALAAAGAHAGPGVLRLDAVAEPVRAGRGARLVPERTEEPFSVLLPGRGLG
jgi:hypothetical protein